MVTRLVAAHDPVVIATYEEKLGEIARDQARLREKIEAQRVPAGRFEEKLEPALRFLANPWKLWESRSVTLRRLILKLVFADRVTYHRNQGPRTAKITLPFKALGGHLRPKSLFWRT